MSLVILCENKDLSIVDIYRLVSGIDASGNFYLRTYDDGTDPDTLENLVDCESGDISILDILRGLLVVNAAGDYCINIATLTP